MSDFKKPIPVRTETPGDVSVKVSDKDVPSQQLKVNVDGSINTTINNPSIEITANDLDIRDLNASSDSVSIGDGINELLVNSNGSINVEGPLTDSELRASPISVVLDSEPLLISGTENGQPGGTEFTFVNNIRSQILAAKDREQDFTYADFGTPNQRITLITYNAPSIGSGPGFTANKTLTYTLIGNKYRRDSINWTIS